MVSLNAVKKAVEMLQVTSAATLATAKTKDLQFAYDENDFPVFTDGSTQFSVCKMRDVLSWHKSSSNAEEDVLNMLEYLKFAYSQITYYKTTVTRGLAVIKEIDYILE